MNDNQRPHPLGLGSSFHSYFLLLLLAGVAVVIFKMVKVFLVPVMLAAVFAGIFYPLYTWLMASTGQRENVSAMICCVLLLACLVAPIYLIANLVAREAGDFYQTLEGLLVPLMQQDTTQLKAEFQKLPWYQALEYLHIDWEETLLNSAKSAGTAMAAVINKTTEGTVQLLTSLVVTFFTMFYFFRDGEQLVARLKYLSPLDERYETALIERFASVSRATLKGTLFIGLTQGLLGGITLWAFGFPSPVLWSTVMALASILPLLGAGMVLYPAAIYSLVTGDYTTGIAIIAITAVIISSIDNVMRPWLVGRETGLHDLIIFFSTLGGIGMFGVMGFILGPILAALFLTILDFYAIEFKDQLDPGEHPLP
ncbi:MAG: AI-2E family transporter [Candidatus Latescibacteria bacterium]|nr:AI-2E family transporter [Candidatus Latescibacterota bacterium]